VKQKIFDFIMANGWFVAYLFIAGFMAYIIWDFIRLFLQGLNKL